MSDNRIRFWQWVVFAFGAAAATVGLNYAFRGARAQIDLTQDSRYTIPPALERIARTRIPKDKSVSVSVYVSENLPGYIGHLPRNIRTRLEEIRRAVDGRLEYEFIDPKDDEDLISELRDSFKIEPLRLSDVREGEVAQGMYYLSMLFRHENQSAVLNLVELNRELISEERTLSALPGLFAARLLKVTTQPEDVVVGIAAEKKVAPPQPGQPGQPTDGLMALRQRLEGHAHVKDVTIKGGVPVPADISTLLLYKPEGLTPRDAFELDQFLMRGGRLIVLLDNYSTFDLDRLDEINAAFKQDKFSLRPIQSGLSEWLAFHGINVQQGVVLDRFNCKMIRQMVGMPEDVPSVVSVRAQDAARNPTGQMDAAESTLAGLAGLAFIAPAPLEIDAGTASRNDPDCRVDALVWSSDESWVVRDPGQTLDMLNVAPADRNEWKRSVLMARATGPLRSYWADKPPPPRPGAQPAESQPSSSVAAMASRDKPAQLWVISDADFIHDVWLDALPKRGMMVQGLGLSVAMLLNVVDAVALGPELVEIRRARLADRSIDDERVKADRDQILFRNIWLMPIVFIAFGLLWWVFRAAQTFVPSPRHPVTVAPSNPSTAEAQP